MKLFMAVVMGLLNQSCKGQPGKILNSPITKYLVSAEAKSTVSAQQLRKNYGQVSTFVRNGYTAYRLTYNTTYVDGSAVVASGAVLVPDIQAPVSLMNYDHGSYFPGSERNAPSYLLPGNHELTICKLFSGAGYLVVMPDYPGYGATKDLRHPYGAYNIIAGSNIDMLRAVKEFCQEKNIRLSGKNFFSGWSEGAAIALATVKTLEEKFRGEFTPSATVINAGPYYSSGFVNYILDAKKPLPYINSYVWVLTSYNWVYKLNRPYQYYFDEPAATDLQSGPEAWISHDPSRLFTDTFRKDYKAGKDTAFIQAMAANDLWDWKPASRVVFCHGDQDEYVPVFNSEKAYNNMKAMGADVSLHIFKGQTHSSGVLNFVQDAFTTFELANRTN